MSYPVTQPAEANLSQLESLQDEVLLRLDELNERLESLLASLSSDDSSMLRVASTLDRIAK